MPQTLPCKLQPLRRGFSKPSKTKTATSEISLFGHGQQFRVIMYSRLSFIFPTGTWSQCWCPGSNSIPHGDNCTLRHLPQGPHSLGLPRYSPPYRKRHSFPGASAALRRSLLLQRGGTLWFHAAPHRVLFLIVGYPRSRDEWPPVI